MIHNMLASFLFYVPAIISFIYAIIDVKKESYWTKIILSIFACFGIIVFTRFSIINICKLHCILNTTVTESTEQYGVLGVEEINHLYHIRYNDNGIVKSVTMNEIYDICENTEMLYDIKQNSFSKETDYIVKLTEMCSSPKTLQKIASLPSLLTEYQPIKGNQIRIYTQNEKLLNQHNGDCIWYYIGYALLGLYIATPTICKIYEQLVNNKEQCLQQNV